MARALIVHDSSPNRGPKVSHSAQYFRRKYATLGMAQERSFPPNQAHLPLGPPVGGAADRCEEKRHASGRDHETRSAQRDRAIDLRYSSPFIAGVVRSCCACSNVNSVGTIYDAYCASRNDSDRRSPSDYAIPRSRGG